MNDYFKRAGNLEEESKKEESSFFHRAGDLDNGDKYFSRAGNLGDSKSKKEEYEEYLLTVVSGVRSPSEFGVIRNCGTMVNTWDRLKELVSLGYNIVKAEYINDELVSFEYESPVIGENKGRGR